MFGQRYLVSCIIAFLAQFYKSFIIELNDQNCGANSTGYFVLRVLLPGVFSTHFYPRGLDVGVLDTEYCAVFPEVYFLTVFLHSGIYLNYEIPICTTYF